MWKLKIADGGGPFSEYLNSTNNFVGRQTWEFDPDAGTPEEREEVERARREFYKNRFQIKPCGDVLLRLQLLKENRDKFDLSIPPVKLGEGDVVTDEVVTTTLKRAVRFVAAIQTSDGHWAADISGPLFFMPPLVFSLYITGVLETILPAEHRKEILRYMYYHQSLCMLSCWVENPHSDAFKKHLARVQDYLWVAEDGMKMQSLGSQNWDTCFAMNALIASNLLDEIWGTLKKGHDYLKQSQIKDNPSGNFRSMYRHISKGSWAFSDQDHGWQVSDCTAEGLMACLLMSQMPSELVGPKMEADRLYDAVNIILSLQSKNGGLAAWEPVTAPEWLEVINPTEFLQDIVVEHEYVECTASTIVALISFKKLYPGCKEKDIDAFISKAVHYIEKTQRVDGSWYGCWGICFIYGTWFALRGLTAAGMNCHNSETVLKACNFLLSKQLECGGWGESYRSSPGKVFIPLENGRSNLVHTAWALLGLLNAGQMQRDPTPLHRGVKVLINGQMDNGDFPQQEITGVFLRNCMLHYATYRNMFPLWALGEYRHKCF